MKLHRVFIHGLESSRHGTKALFFGKRYPDMIIEDFYGTMEERMGTLIALLAKRKPLIIVGSSLGGLMATIFACKYPENIHKLVLLAPALSSGELVPYMHLRVAAPVFIYHGRQDRVVPAGAVHEIARRLFTDLHFYMVDDDHRLSKSFRCIPWDDLLDRRPVP